MENFKNIDLPIYRMVVDENDDTTGLFAMGLVENPAIGVNWQMFSEEDKKQVKLSLNEDEMVITGPALIPDKLIKRVDEDDSEYFVYFTKEDIKIAVKKLFKYPEFLHMTTEQHIIPLEGNYIFESWVVSDSNKDKSAALGYRLPVGTWMVSLKVDEKFWKEKVKTGIVKAFSIEGIFKHLSVNFSKEEKFASFNDYPKAASNNAARAIKYKEENGSSCGTPVGWTRARQLANKQPISQQTIQRTYSFLSRSKGFANGNDLSDCGLIMYLAWGGDEMLRWCENKLNQIDKEEDLNRKRKDIQKKIEKINSLLSEKINKK